MAAVLATGTTTIYHAACEPYLQQLCAMLNRMGPIFKGGLQPDHHRRGREPWGTDHRLLADMIEVDHLSACFPHRFAIAGFRKLNVGS